MLLPMRLPYFLLSSQAWGLNLAIVWGLLASQPSLAQAAPPADSLSQRLRHYSRQALTEQLFLHLDRPAYVAGETLWFKAYVVEGTYHRPLGMSKVAYVEVLDADQRPVLQVKTALVHAMGQGSLALPAELATGRYVVRAYTNWMKNAGPDFYFQQPITVANTAASSAAVVPPTKAGPVYDVQFFPEGGQLVQGLPGRVAFKVTDRYGRSVAATGTVADARGTTLATFQTLKFGMGSFLLTPAAAGAAYTATLRLPDGKVLTSKLPAVAEQGYALQVTDNDRGQLIVAVQAQGAGATGSLHLLAHSGQRVTVEADAAFSGGQAVFQVDKRRLHPGITHFTVFAEQRPVGERLYFRRPAQALRIQGQAAAAAYGTRRQVRLQVGAPQAAALSLAVYRLDSLSTEAPADIASHLLLAADLTGFVEDAGYYFRDSSAVAQQAADNLMLTQGWRRFRWEDVAAGRPPTISYPPELNGYLLQGRVSQPDGAPAAGVNTYLSLPGHVFWFNNATSHADGTVQFELPHVYGARKLVFQTNPLPDSLYRVELLSPFTRGGGAAVPGLPPLSARLATTLSERHLQVQAQQAFPAPPARYLPVPTDTVAFYGRPDEHYRLDDYTRFPTMEEVMREYVPGVLVRKRRDGFHFLVVDRPRHITLKENPLTLIDGLPVFKIDQIMAFDPLKVKTLDVMANRYFVGQQAYDGLVSYYTYKGDLGGFPLNPHALIEEYETLQVPREFYAPRYDTEAQQRSRLPDLRNLLYWNPNIQLAADKPQNLEFFTSDQAGRYLVMTQGLTPDGQLGSTSFLFDVKPTL
ncbi:MAG: hypothetical protein EOO56_01165 [Hymenobacter sp.]|nr:MAG: hypothetical protein EOO56_01165 [Hymenobacter sp.]